MRKVLIFLLASIALGLAYYFLIRPSDYTANFVTKTLPGDVIETIRIWNKSLDDATIIKVDSFSGLSQRINYGGREYTYEWRFSLSGDSLTKVSIGISEPGNSAWNRLLIPFKMQPIEQDANEIVRQFYDVLKVHLQITRVNVLGEVYLPPKFCICSTAQTLQVDKAKGMMRDFLPLSTFVDQMNLSVDGPPLIRIQLWNHDEGSLEFDFCFPIMEAEKLPRSREFTYKSFPSQRALKAEYFGNYITSDRAWYELIRFAQRNDYEITGFPIEVFHNNPNLGMNEKEWKADVFLPVQKTFRETGGD